MQQAVEQNMTALCAAVTMLGLSTGSVLSHDEKAAGQQAIAADRFQSMMLINQDEYVPIPVEYKPGKYVLTQDKIGTRYVAVVIRTFVNAGDPADIKKANAIQDQIKAEQKSVGKFESPNWDKKSQDSLRAAIHVLAATMDNFRESFGTKEEVDPIAHVLGTESGWGGNPAKDGSITIHLRRRVGAYKYTGGER